MFPSQPEDTPYRAMFQTLPKQVYVGEMHSAGNTKYGIAVGLKFVSRFK